VAIVRKREILRRQRLLLLHNAFARCPHPIQQRLQKRFYPLESTTVYVHCVTDGRRDIQDILQERLLR
jgi:hypothetical protein